jgi:hypothetical protein
MCRVSPPRWSDPVPDLKWIHGIQTLRCFAIGDLATVRARIPGGVKSEPGAGGHAYPVMRYSPESDGTGRGPITIDNHPLAEVRTLSYLST